MKFSKKEALILVGMVALFLVLRLPGIYLPYHQDEYKWPTIVNSALTQPGGIPHPPLGEAIYRTTGETVGYDNFRLTPLFFGFLNLILVYFVVRRRYSVKAAQWSALFFTLSYYSILASLMVDTDGQILPFFFLLSLWFYDSFNLSQNRKKWFWFFLTIVFMVLGMLVKMSFVIGIGAIATDFIFSKWKEINRKAVISYISGFIGFGIIIFTFLYFAQDIFPGFSFSKIVLYSEKFMKGFGGRNFLQIGIQSIKALLYLSPALILIGLSSLWPYRKDLRLFHIFIGLGLIFYLVIFDFSEGALDRYLQFLIIPLCVISGVISTELINEGGKISKKGIIFIFLILTLIFSVQFFEHYIPPLYPKAEWISRTLSFKWNFLYPFSGGSGPLPFYVSFAFLALIWIYSLTLIIPAFIKNNFEKRVLVGILVLSFPYNMVFTEEYMFGKINGNTARLVKDSTEFIKDNPDIKKVVVYNDNGGREIQQTGKYTRRLYAIPQSEIVYKEFFKNFSGHVLYINIPRIGDNNFYSNYFDSCKNIYEKQDKYITAKVLDCSQTK